tara:strand:- start:469 stop:666 length:198 start_codon:yes stop_codon:yes gene_type:complete
MIEDFNDAKLVISTLSAQMLQLENRVQELEAESVDVRGLDWLKRRIKKMENKIESAIVPQLGKVS